MMIMTTTVPEREYGENFPVALWILPRDIREHLHTLYQIARMIDDTGDQLAGDRTEQLMEIRRELSTVWNGEPRTAPMLRLAATVGACHLTEQPFQELVEANLQDQQTSRYPTFEDLLAYCRLSAVPVGRMVLRVFGQTSVELEQLSDDVCVALQLLEHWQDVGEDCRNGRVYLPQEDMAAFEVTRTDLLATSARPRLRELMLFEIDRAEELLNRGRPILGRLQGWGQVAVAGYLAGGYATVAALQRSRGDVLSQSTEPRRSDIAINLARLLLRPRTESA